MRTLDIIIPVYNEERTLVEIVKKIEDTDYCGLEKRLIIVDDGSTDRTKEILKKYSNHTLIYHSQNMGKGSAIWTGIQASNADIIIIQDADMEYNPQDYQSILPLIINGEESAVYGSRFLKPENRKTFLFLSYIANKFLTFLTNLLYGTRITDMETCYKAFRCDVLNDIEIKSKKFEFEVEITAKIAKKGIKIKEVPISYNGREYKSGKKISWKDAIHAIVALLYYRFYN